jgi:hypothetical protein
MNKFEKKELGRKVRNEIKYYQEGGADATATAAVTTTATKNEKKKGGK